MCLKEKYMPERTERMWHQIAEKFAATTHFPNCLGAIDGKHIRIQKPCSTGSEFMNYKNFFSVVLMAVVDAEYCFTSVYGSASDSHVFERSNFGKKTKRRLNLTYHLISHYQTMAQVFQCTLFLLSTKHLYYQIMYNGHLGDGI